jgi:hypothetical protein
MNDNFYAVPASQQSIESTPLAKINLGANSKRCMDNLVLEAEIQELVAEGRVSQLRQKLTINKLHGLLDDHCHFLAGRLAGSPCLDEAWVNTLSHCLVNFWAVPEDDKRTGSAYCNSPNIVYRIRKYFRHRIEYEEMKQRGATRNKEPLPLSLDAPISEDGSKTLGDEQAAPAENEDYLHLRELIEVDATGKVQKMVMKSQPQVNLQKVLHLFLEGYTWRDIAKKMMLGEQALYSFLRRHGWDLLKELWEESDEDKDDDS